MVDFGGTASTILLNSLLLLLPHPGFLELIWPYALALKFTINAVPTNFSVYFGKQYAIEALVCQIC